jgi:hypothetical protein
MPPGMPIRILAGLAKDIYRKPNIGMFDVVQAVYRARGYEVDLEESVFVGDAAGRMPYKGKAKDHGDTDFKFALNVGLRFLTPEVGCLSSPALRADRIRNIFSERPDRSILSPQSASYLLVWVISPLVRVDRVYISHTNLCQYHTSSRRTLL